MKYKNFQIVIFGDLEYERLVAEIYFKDEIVALLTQEHGYENLEIEIYPPENQNFWVFNFFEFQEAIQHAKRRLWEPPKLPEDL